MSIKQGLPAPDFTLADQNGEIRSLSDFEGTWVLLYFYPKDDTPGCTKEACAIRDAFPNFRVVNATVIGVSADSVESHKKFAEKYGLTFTLLADTEKKAANLYKVWDKKTVMGREYEGMLRTSFLIDPIGVIVKVYENVNPEGHAEEALKDLKKFAAPAI